MWIFFGVCLFESIPISIFPFAEDPNNSLFAAWSVWLAAGPALRLTVLFFLGASRVRMRESVGVGWEEGPGRAAYRRIINRDTRFFRSVVYRMFVHLRAKHRGLRPKT